MLLLDCVRMLNKSMDSFFKWARICQEQERLTRAKFQRRIGSDMQLEERVLLNGSPEFTPDMWTIDLPEDTAPGIVASAVASDPEGDPIDYGILMTDGPFSIDSNTGEISLDGPLDFESMAVHTIDVNALDDSFNEGYAWITVNVLDVAEPPTGAPPVADLLVNGASSDPVTIKAVDSMDLDASGSFDPDETDSVSFSWDLDDDGTYGDGGHTDSLLTLTWDEVSSDFGWAIGDARTVSVEVTDDEGEISTASINVEIDPPDPYLFGVNDSYSTMDDIDLVVDASAGVLANDYYTIMGPILMQATVDSAPAQGSLSLNSDGSFTYDANDGYYGSDSWSYFLSDGVLTIGPIFVSMNVKSIEIQYKPGGGDYTSVDSDTTTEVWVGESIGLRANILGAGQPQITVSHWNIPGVKVNDYHGSKLLGSILDEFQDAELLQDEVSFHWVDGADERIVTLNYLVMDPIGNSYFASKTTKFEVKRPDVSISTATSSVRKYTNMGGFDVVEFGNTDTTTAGIEFIRTATTAPGEWRWIQTGTTYRERMLADGTYLRQQGEGLDSIHDGVLDEDSPQQGLAGRYFHRNDQFRNTLMYKSDTEGSIWVPMDYVDWYWSFGASSDDGIAWILNESDHGVSAPVDTLEFPMWTQDIEDGLEEWESGD